MDKVLINIENTISNSKAINSEKSAKSEDLKGISSSLKKTKEKLKQKVSKTEPFVQNIDVFDRNDPNSFSLYAESIYDNYFKDEDKFLLNYNYLDDHRYLTPLIRGKIIDWMIEVHFKYRMHTEAIYLAVNYFDRFLEKKLISKSKVQLVGLACLVISSKFEESYGPKPRDFLKLTKSCYSKPEIVEMESLILSVLRFELTIPATNKFIARFLKAGSANQTEELLVHYLSEKCLCEYTMLKYKNSLKIASCLYIAHKLTEKRPYWNKTLEKYTTYKEEDLLECVDAIEFFLSKPSLYESSKKKYKNTQVPTYVDKKYLLKM